MKEKPSCKNGFHSVALSGLNNIFQVLWVPRHRHADLKEDGPATGMLTETVMIL